MLLFEMPAAITVEKVRFVLRPDTYDYDITTKFQGSTNGSTWTDLLTTTDKFDNPSSLYRIHNYDNRIV